MSARLRPLRLTPFGLAACLLATAICSDARADEPTAPAGSDRARIADAARGLDGRAAINQTAGVGNAQANLAAIAITPEGLALASLHADQRIAETDIEIDAARIASGRASSARIDAHAFADSRGLVQLNQSAGSGNRQLNAFALSHGRIATGVIAGLDDAALASVAGANGDDAYGANAAPSLREAVIADDAFRGGQGVLQLNQTAGIGNASVNAIVLQLPGGVP
ncbi:hypothetical protein [Lysobacter sp. Root690]|uniref:hypothetical protein n=1 Tax=Lysobacter sp. Root690 TaxID=1736588 RepID=UPI0006FAB2D9|nr:hypothetical protein [Lysobacter sp. Root690]KRB07685.1 hypothetical protein ASD86_07635 [Lysobacter sp. Root690]